MKHHVTIAPYLKALCQRLERGEIELAGYAGGHLGRYAFDGPIDDLHQLYFVFMVPAAIRGEYHKGILTRTIGARGVTTDIVEIFTDHAVEHFVLCYAEKSPLT